MPAWGSIGASEFYGWDFIIVVEAFFSELYEDLPKALVVPLHLLVMVSLF